MAFKYKRTGSPFWWWSFVETTTGKRRYESMHLEVASREDTRKAMIKVHQQNLIEIAVSRLNKADAWDAWVPEYINLRFYGEAKPNQGALRECVEKPQSIPERKEAPLPSAAQTQAPV